MRKFRELCFEKFGYEPTKDAAFEGIQRACEEHQFNSVQHQIAIEEFDFDAEASRSVAPIAAELAIFQNQDLVTPR